MPASATTARRAAITSVASEGRYLGLGGTGSRLGPPVSDVYAVAAGLRSNFVHGAIIWNRTGTTSVIYY